MRSDETSVTQMFQDYAAFKYDIYRWRLETNVQSQLNSQTSSAGVDIGEKLKYDLGTKILLNTLQDKISTKISDSTSRLSYYKDPQQRNMNLQSSPGLLRGQSEFDKLAAYAAQKAAHDEAFITE